jgi:ABC-type amino acid transport substrate-binding protein
MFKIFNILFNKLFCFVFLNMLLGCSEKSDDELKVGVCADSPPFTTMESGDIVGFEIDLSEAISKKLNKKIILKDMDFAALIPSIQSDKIDMAVALFENTPQRAKNVDFSIPYYKSQRMLLSLNSLPSDNIVSDMSNGKKIGVQIGSTHQRYLGELQKSYPDWTSEIRIYDTVGGIFQDLNNQRISRMIIDKATANIFLQKYKIFGAILPTDDEGYVFVLRKGSLLTIKINKAIGELRQDGTLKKLSKKWLGD